ncbi:methyl-accepting chemotaxis protein [Marinomonas rhizomae]|uniref:methyl-accepting chemotaxis protein n=1 Tax=Marinomonas rhizomae TaxID=491948 RepID=UPI002104FFAB|nr:PAS domain-containing methyl-accepting chemotaxis protein [Marinomonas rhizomae]UTW00439.1 methyl-accepting chemotaxis protein [Marinomonas rhizomae]
MRQNTPVTNQEKTFSKNEKLITTTDLKGKILHCNDAFVKISGFDKSELIGSPHNIVRHPDMPKEAFQIMWDTLKQGKAWMGLVKNRCKNGDFYWVDAYVTPVTESGKVVGYESVRTVPSREDVARAEKVYQRINSGKNVIPRSFMSWKLILPLVGIVLTLAAGSVNVFYGVGVLAATSLLANVLFLLNHSKLQATLKQRLSSAFLHPLAGITYSDTSLDIASLDVGVKSLLSRMDAVLTRFEDESLKVSEQSKIGLALTIETTKGMVSQQHETQDVAAAMQQMTMTINDVAQHVQMTADSAKSSSQTAGSGQKIVEETRQSIRQLSETVNDIGATVQELADRSEQIAQVAQMIDQIAEQTNLLALNAAIEAARAGEHGRGFAVVADEVRQLAQRTQDSTKDIHHIIETLRSGAKNSVSIANQGRHDATQGLEKIIEMESAFGSIVEGVSKISDMAMQMSAAVEEQAHVSEDINRQVVRISDLSVESSEKSNQSSDSIRALQDVANNMHELVVRFK